MAYARSLHLKFCCYSFAGPHSIHIVIQMFPVFFEVTLRYFFFYSCKGISLRQPLQLELNFFSILKQKEYWLIFLLLAEGIITSLNLFCFFLQSNLTGSSNKPVSKRVEVKAGSNLGGIQNIGIKNIASQASATVSSHLTLPNENKGDGLQEKTGTVFFLLLKSYLA